MEQSKDYSTSENPNPTMIPKYEAPNEQVEQYEDDDEAGNGMNPLLMEYIVSHLVKFLNLESSKTSRLVCKLWNAEINKSFFKNRVIRVPNTFHASFGSNNKKKNGELNKLKKYFSSVGKIQALKFNDHRDSQSFIRLGLPWEKIEVIVLTGRQTEAEEEMNVKKSFDELLQVALCLKRVELPVPTSNNDSFMKLLGLFRLASERSRANVVPILLSGYILKIRNIEELTEVQILSDLSMIQLEKLSLASDFDITTTTDPGLQFQVAWMIQEILESSKNVLVKLDIENCFANVGPALEIPVLPKLEDFVLVCEPTRFPQGFEFTPDFQFHKNMPNLKSVKMTLGYGTNAQLYWDNAFPNIEPASSVQELELTSYLELVPNKIFDTFSWIKSLKIKAHVTVDFLHLGQCCPELKIVTYSLLNNNAESKLLLSKITGFSLDTIEKCLSSSVIENIEDLRVNTSLLDLPGLELLHLVGCTTEFRWFKMYLPLLRNLILNRIPHVKFILSDWTNPRAENNFGL